MSFFRPAIDDLTAYQPGEQPAANAGIIKLNTNENPYPPSPRAVAALRAIQADALRLYPQPTADEFRQSAAAVLGVDPDWILVGNGSDDLLTMLFRSVADAQRAVAFPTPTYVLYRTLAQIQGAPVRAVPFDDGFALPVDALVSTQAALTLIASPNSPSGNRIPNDALTDVATRSDGLVVIDEAYAEFATDNALALTTRHDNVVVLRTLSKSHSLAGLRLGYAVAHPALVAGLAKVKDSYNVDAVAAHVGSVAVGDVEHTAANVRRVRASRERLAVALSALGHYVWPSDANFLLVRPPHGDARSLYEQLKQQGILVRHFDEPMLTDCLRITVGTDEQNERLVAALPPNVTPPARS